MKTTQHVCHDCGVKEGQIHQWNCDMERCPKCGHQVISCACELTQAQAEKLGRVPYIVYPNMCARCGALWPEMFHVADSVWKRYVQKSERHQMLCLDCFHEIRKLIDKAVVLAKRNVKA